MKKIVFLTGTRADFGKLKSLINIAETSQNYDVHIFVTGMHLSSVYGWTYEEIEKCNFKNIYKVKNDDFPHQMDKTLASTIVGFSDFVKSINPDLVIIHGDRVEALAGAIVGSLNNILVAHIEGGELSGTIDELIRHSVSKISHIHLVANKEAEKRLIQMGEHKETIFILGSPDLDLMSEKSLPSIQVAKNYYDISFEKYSIAMFHPVTTEYDSIKSYSKNFIKSLIKSGKNYILIYPNNDLGSEEIIEEIIKIKNSKKIKVFPSLRFEYFLRFLKNSEFIIGNSSAGIREAPYYNVPSIDIGTRQKNRASFNSIFKSDYDTKSILNAIDLAVKYTLTKQQEIKHDYHFGAGQSDKLFLKLLDSKKLWEIKHQKQFQDIN